MVSHSALAFVLTQLILNRSAVMQRSGPGLFEALVFTIGIVGLLLAIVWFLTNLRGFYYSMARIDIVRDLERRLVADPALGLYGVLGREFALYSELTEGSLPEIYRAQAKRYGPALAAPSALLCWGVLRHWSSRYRLVAIPALFMTLWVAFVIAAFFI